ncbi:double-strand break repair protein AddB [Loktanella sp. IMCC34160]|uniref:double-strand break repair protein AddB n=1 Tax=Loktanella sp. IMCC34160 TaxID=2510646 RepID=UPI00101BB71A|nr:double-strand break repair protein AddB [Loktanella sp. IMCC34160]RYG91310.1 double-strand break repair protein AddB [Loktanella sp. IMCC34160]
MFEPTDRPRVFGLAPGVDFGKAVVDGLLDRTRTQPPEALARVEVFVNTRRMARRMQAVFGPERARLLPRIRLVTDLSQSPVAADIPPAVAPLRRRLELTQLVAKLLEQDPDIAPRAALFDLSDSLAGLLDEMHGECVSPEALEALDVSDLSEHWDRSLKFLRIARQFFGSQATAPDQEARQRLVVERLVADWAQSPPDHPVVIAGSTGSRGATALLMEAVARLPQGAVILPGFDFDMPAQIWDRMAQPDGFEDHPQYRFKRLMDGLDLRPQDVTPWSDATAPDPARNRLLSLALRPAPVTDGWRQDGPGLGDMGSATRALSLLQAPSPRMEAETIALRLRAAVEDGKTAALITPDRTLTRQVAAALDRWNITPDDSAGQPLHLSPPGRFLRHVADLLVGPVTAETLLVLLKHPLAATGSSDRGPHLRLARELELHLRRHGPPFPTGDTLRRWAQKTDPEGGEQTGWATWLAGCLDGIQQVDLPSSLPELLALHRATAERFAAGPGAGGSGALWAEAAGREALKCVSNLAEVADASGPVSLRDYQSLFNAILSKGEVRNPDTGHPQVLFWGTLEARVQSADLVILAGLNDGTWPAAPGPDPWLNRRMRADAGLLLPERRIGLSAHDFQQAAAGPEVWLSRSVRSDEAETIPSRWLNRLTNLLNGLTETGGPDAFKAMQARGDIWLAQAAKLQEPEARTDPAHRPSPRPPVADRPREISVTQVKTLVRDPYAIYARDILGLKPVDPLVPEPDAPLRGILIHEVMERFIFDGPDPADLGARDALMQIARAVFAEGCPWPTIRQLWIARFDNVVDSFLEDEVQRRALATPAQREATGQIDVPGVNVRLKARADRIDRTPDGGLFIYDYKTGNPPSKSQQLTFDKQLLLQAAMAARGAFAQVGAAPTKGAAFIGLGSDPKVVPAPLDDESPDDTWDGLVDLLSKWQRQGRGYSARMAMEKSDDKSDYDHLSRYGEWSDADDVTPEDLT